MNGAPPRRIWLCADDYGISPGVNRAIRDLIGRGLIAQVVHNYVSAPTRKLQGNGATNPSTSSCDERDFVLEFHRCVVPGVGRGLRSGRLRSAQDLSDR